MSTEAAAGSHLSIGEVLDQLRSEFPDVTISKIRFLESQGLIDPERTPSGYRRFYPPDLQRLRWILLQQRDHFLPLRVIKERLDAFGPTGAPRIGSANGGSDRSAPVTSRPAPTSTPTAPRPPDPGPTDPGPVPARPTDPERSPAPAPRPPSAEAPRPGPAPRTGAPRARAATAPGAGDPRQAAAPNPPARPARAPLAELGDDIDTEDDESRVGAVGRGRDEAASTDLTRTELLEATGLTDSQLDGLESFGIIAARPGEDSRPRYDDEMLAVAELAAGCYRRGIEARHLKMYWHFAEREASLFAQVLLPYVRQRNPASRARLQAELEELARLGRRLRTAMLRRALRSTSLGE